MSSPATTRTISTLVKQFAIAPPSLHWQPYFQTPPHTKFDAYKLHFTLLSLLPQSQPTRQCGRRIGFDVGVAKPIKTFPWGGGYQFFYKKPVNRWEITVADWLV
jgi:hypothetical protein